MNNKNEIKLEWTNQDEFSTHLQKLKSIYGSEIPAEIVMDFRFEFNNGESYIGKIHT